MSKKNADRKIMDADKRIALGRKLFLNRKPLRTLADEGLLKLVVGGNGPADDDGDRLAANHNGKLVKVVTA